MSERWNTPDLGATRRRRIAGGIGMTLLGAAVLMNEWSAAALFSDDGALAPLSVVRVRALQFFLAVCGSVVFAGRKILGTPSPVRSLMRQRPGTAASLFGVFLAAALWGAGELAFTYVNNQRGTPAYDIHVTTLDGRPSSDSIAEVDELLGYKLTPSRRARIRVTHSGRLIYDITTETDEFSRRVTPVDGTSQRRRFLLFFGCSYTWGQGVQDDETLPAAFGRMDPDTTPYNYGYRGYGPQQAVELLRAVDLRTQVQEPVGDAIFTMMDEHVRRAIGGMRTATSARATFPYFELQPDGSIARRGSFITGRPWRQFFYDIVSRSAVLNFFNFDLPVRINDDHLELVAAMLADARSNFDRQFPGRRFQVVLYPGSKSLARLTPKLEARGVSYFNYIDLFPADDPAMTIAGDGHPTGEAYRRVAEQLARDLGRASGSTDSNGGAVTDRRRSTSYRAVKSARAR